MVIPVAPCNRPNHSLSQSKSPYGGTTNNIIPYRTKILALGRKKSNQKNHSKLHKMFQSSATIHEVPYGRPTGCQDKWSTTFHQHRYRLLRAILYQAKKKICNKGRIKVYVAVFVYLAIRAVHLELTSGLSTDVFIVSLKKFIYFQRKMQDDLFQLCRCQQWITRSLTTIKHKATPRTSTYISQ